MKWISNTFFADLNRSECHGLTQSFFNQVNHWLTNNGPVWTITRLKALRNIVTRYIVKDPILVNQSHIGVDKSGFPKSLIFLKEYVDSGEIQKLRFVMTL
jgi:hypothetical protein